MKRFSVYLSLLLVVACGNPHLTTSGGASRTNTSLEAGRLRNVVVSNADGGSDLSVVTDQPSITGQLTVNNPNTEAIDIVYSFQKGTHFRYNGGAFPGTNGSCTSDALPTSNCALDIEFFADDVGVYDDNLLVTYGLQSKPQERKTIVVPLRGERTALATLIPIELIPAAGGTQMSFSTESSSVNGQLSERNPNNSETIVTYAFESGAHFRFNGGQFPGTNGNCTTDQSPHSSCEMDIEFFATAAGLYTDNLIATYALKSSPEHKLTVRLPLRGEKRVNLPSSVTVRPINGGSSIDFGVGNVNGSSQTDRIEVRNTGATSQDLSVRLVGGYPFAINSHCPAMLAPGEFCEIDVTYSPAHIGLQRDVVEVTHHLHPAGASTTVNTPIIAETITPPLKPGKLVLGGLSPDHVDFGTVDVGSEVRRTVEIKNIGELPVTLHSNLITGSNFTFNGGNFPGQHGTCGNVILPGSCMLELNFRPDHVGGFGGNLVLLPTVGDALTILMSGVGQQSTTEICYRTEELQVRARPSASATGVVFPYLTSHPSTTSRLSLLYGTATNGRIAALNRYIVKDAEVYVSFDLPKVTDEIVDVLLDMDVTKVIQDNYKDTESLCLSTSGLRKCSGREFSLDSWHKLRNPSFWNPFEVPVTSLYEDEFRSGQFGCGNYHCYTMVKALSLKRLFDLSNSNVRSLTNQRVNFVFSDDTRLRTMPIVRIRTKKPVACQ